MMIANSTSKSWHNKPTKTAMRVSKGNHKGNRNHLAGNVANHVIKTWKSMAFPWDMIWRMLDTYEFTAPQKQCQVKFRNKMVSTVFTLVFTPKKIIGIHFGEFKKNTSGWWFQPLRKILVSWDYSSIYGGK